MKKLFFLICALVSAGSHAAIINIGSYSIDEVNFADSATLVAGSNPKSASNIIGSDFNQFISIDDSNVLEFNFTDNSLYNDVGDDFLIFELASVEESSVSLTLGGATLVGTYLETDFSYPGSTFRINIFGFDLSDLGIALGSQYTSSLYISTSGGSPDIAAAAVLNDSFGSSLSVSSPINTAFMIVFGLMMSRSLRNYKLRASS